MAGFDVQEAVKKAQSGPFKAAQGQFDAHVALKKVRGEAREALPGDVLGAEFDPENVADTGLRFDLSRGDTLEEKRLRLQKRFPEGDVQAIQDPGFGQGRGMFKDAGEDILVYRESEGAQWKRIDPEGFEAGDIAEAIGPSVESIVGETAMAIGSGGRSVLMTIGRQILGAALGEAGEQAGQYLTGTQAQTPGEVATEVGIEAGLSGVGGVVASPLAATGNVLRGAGALRVGEEGTERIAAASRIDPDLAGGLTPGMVTDNPALRLSEKQSAALVPGLQRRYRDLIDIMDKGVRRRIGSTAKVKDRVGGALKRMQDNFLSRLKNVGGSNTKGGQAIQGGIEGFDAANRDIVGRMYDQARAIEEPQFNLSPFIDVARDLKAGVKGNLDPAVAKVLGFVQGIRAPIQKSDGSFVSIADQYRNARTELNALAHVEPGKIADQTTGQASSARNALNDVLKKPENSNPEFVEAWKWADRANTNWHNAMEKISVVNAAKSQNPAALVKTYAKPGEIGNLLNLRDASTVGKWDEFRSAFYADLTSDPATLSKKLHGFDQETLDVLMPRSDQEAWKIVATGMDRINAVGADQIAERQISNKNFIDSLVTGADPRATHTLMKAINETNDVAARNSLRAGILEWAWDGVVRQGKNTLEANPELLTTRIAGLKRSGLWRTLTAPEKQIIGDALVVSKAFRGVIDAGTSIRAAEAVSGIQSFKASALMTFVRASMVGHFYTSPMGRRILIGSGMPHSNGAAIRLLAGSMAQVLPPTDISQLVKEDEDKGN